MSEDQGRPVKPHRSGGGYPYRTIESVVAAVPLPNYTEPRPVAVNQEDKELLVLAAKACGFGDPNEGRVCWTESEYPKGSGRKGALWNYVGNMDTAQLWNPLADDGDALRLAVVLHICLDFESYEVCAGDVSENPTAEYSLQDATRRAIVRAAAEIGKGGAI